MTISRRTIMQAGLASAAIIGAGRGGRAQGPRVLRFVPEFDLRVLDPIVNTGLVTLQHGYMIYDTLYSMDSSFTPRPQMAEGHTVSSDGLTYTFTLRAGLKFHDGAPVRAQDCVASIRRWGVRDVMGRAITALTETLEAVDDRTFRLKLREAYPLLIDALGKPASSPCLIMRESDAQTDPGTAVTANIGSGPFRFVQAEFQPGSRVVYARNPDYVPRQEPANGYAGGKVVNVDRVEWRIIAEPGTQVNALIAGEVDIVNTPPLDLLSNLRSASGVTVKNLDPQGWFAYIRPNHLFPPFNDVRARRALAMMVNQEDYMRAAAGDRENWNVCHAFMICRSPMGSEAGMDEYKRPNRDRARALLQESGYRGEPIFVLHYTDNALLGAVGEVTINNLRAIGANVRVEASDLATAFQRRTRFDPPDRGGWNIFHTRSLGIELNNPLTSAPLASPCGRNPQGVPNGWFGWACDEQLEGLRARWTRAPNLEERRRIAEQIQLRAADQFPYVPVGQIFTPVAHRSNVRGLIEMPVPVMWNISLG